MSRFLVINLEDLLASGEDSVWDVVGDFSCRHNAEIDAYLINRAVDFTRKSITMTHLVFDNTTSLCVGYFALTHKPVAFRSELLSGNQRKRIARFAKVDARTGRYTVSAYLIAQIGKNYLAEDGKLITGAELLDLAKNELHVSKRQVGGQIVFVEMEHGNMKLANFYRDNGFALFDTREDIEDGRPVTYDQLFLFLK